MPKHEQGNLVYLVYAPNNCYTSVVDECPEGTTINLECGTWRFSQQCRFDQDYPIGRSRATMSQNHGIIGVYDRSNVDHLGSMVSDAKEATNYGPAIHVDD